MTTWHCQVCGHFNVGHPSTCSACAMRQDSLALARCQRRTFGAICGQPAIGIDYDTGQTVCEGHLERYLVTQDG